jgi:acetyl-CoA carboxylase alpha subunit
MKITKEDLQQIIKEELESVVQEADKGSHSEFALEIDHIQNAIYKLSKKARQNRPEVRLPKEKGGEEELGSALMGAWTTLNRIKSVLYSMEQ